MFTIVVSKIQVFDGDSDQATSLGKFCGSSIPVIPQSSSHEILLRLVTDSSQKLSGFEGSYTTEWGNYILHHWSILGLTGAP